MARYFLEIANGIAAPNGLPPHWVRVLAGANGSRLGKEDFRDRVYWGTRMPTFRGSWRFYKPLNDLLMQVVLMGCGSEPSILHETYYGAPRLWNPLVKRVITIYDMIWEEEEFAGTENWVSRAKRVSAERADGILFISESTRQAFHRHYPQRCAEQVVHLGCELRTTRARQPASVPWPFILFVGRREFYKNWSRLVDAMGGSNLWKTHGLVNVGSPLRLTEMEQLRSAGIPADRVMSVRCDDDVLADLYSSADCFVFPSLVEGFGIPLLEAARCGCPIACSDIAVFREILPHGASYFDPLSPDSIAGAITACLEGGRSSPGITAARQRAESFSWQRTADATLRFYHSLFTTASPLT